MKFLIRMAWDISTNTPTPASWDVEVEAESKRAAARKFRRERGFQRTEPLVISNAGDNEKLTRPKGRVERRVMARQGGHE